MSKENLMGRIVSRYLTRSFLKWFALGIGVAVMLGTVVGFSIYYGMDSDTVTDPDNGVDLTTRLAEEVGAEIPNVVHVEIIGNATQAIHERLIWATVDQLGDSSDYSWNVTAYCMFPTDIVDFVLSQSEVDTIASGLVTSIENTEKLGIFGEEPYPAEGDLADLKWVTELYLANFTVIYLYINMDGLILFQTSTWEGDFQGNQNLIGAYVLSPESAFDSYIQVLKDLFTPHLAV